MSESGAGRGGLQRAAAGRRRSQDALAPGQPQVPAARRGEAAAGASRRPPPQQLAAARGRGTAGKAGRGRREWPAVAGPSPACSLSGDGRGRAGSPGRTAGGPRGAPRTKGDGDGSSVVKTTCAGGGPRSGRGLGALGLNPFPAAAASPRSLVAGDRSGRAHSRRVAGSGPQPAEAGQDPSTPLSGPSPRSGSHLLPPRPLPTWIPGRLANSLLREAGRGRGTDPT